MSLRSPDPGTRSRIAWVWVEPTPYMLAAEAQVAAALPEFDIDVYCHTLDASQPWGLGAELKARTVVRSPENAERSTFRDYLRLWKSLESGDYSVCLVEGYGSGSALLTIAWAQIHNIPWVMESDTQLQPRPSYIRFAKRVLLPPLLRRASWLLPGGSPQAKYLIAYGASPNKLSTAYMTVDVEGTRKKMAQLETLGHVVRNSIGLSSQDVLLLYVGRLAPSKGLDSLLEATKLVERNRPTDSVPFRLALVGEGPQRAHLTRMCRDLELNHLLVFCGAQYGDSLLTWYSAADAFVLPSLVEPWGLVVNEAMAAGLPVVVSNAVGASADLVEHGVNGYVFPAGDCTRLAARLKTLIDNPVRRRKMGFESSRRIQKWTMGHYAQAVAGAVRQVLSHGQKPAGG